MIHTKNVTSHSLHLPSQIGSIRPCWKGVANSVWAVIAFCLLLSSAVANETESVFKSANQYTVKIITRVQMPFYDDEKGTFTGTGFLIDAKKGWILTNAHVVSRSPSTVRISFKGREDVIAEKLYVDPLIDVAVLQIPAKNIPDNTTPAPLQCRTMPKVGHPVGVFGHPWDFDYTATLGIVSGYAYREGRYFLQTDAPVNHGNSGGPLISVKSGKVVGIATARLNERQAKRMNFAVPIKYACKIVSLMKKGKDPSPPDLPVLFFDNVNKGKPLKVAKVLATSSDFPLRPGDEILQVGKRSERVTNPAVLAHILRGNIYKDVQLMINRDGRRQTVTFHVKPMEEVSKHQGVYVSGMLIADVPFIDKKDFSLDRTLMVHNIEEGSVAESLKIEEGDFLISVNKRVYQNVSALYLELKKMSTSGKKAHIIFKRLGGDGKHLFSYHEADIPISQLKMVQ